MSLKFAYTFIATASIAVAITAGDVTAVGVLPGDSPEARATRPAQADQKPTQPPSDQSDAVLTRPVFVVLWDLTTAAGADSAQKRIATLPMSQISADTVAGGDCAAVSTSSTTIATYKAGEVLSLIECALGEVPAWDTNRALKVNLEDLNARAMAAGALRLLVPRIAGKGSTRAISSAGDSLLVGVIEDATLQSATYDPEGGSSTQPTPVPSLTDYAVNAIPPTVKVTETARHSEIGSDLETLFSVAAKIATKAGLPPAGLPKGSNFAYAPRPVTWLSVASHVLTLQQASVSVSASVSATGNPKEILNKLTAKDGGPKMLADLAVQVKATLDAKQNAHLDALTGTRQNSLGCPAQVGDSTLQVAACQLSASTPISVRAAAARTIGAVDQPDAARLLARVAGDSAAPAQLRTAALQALRRDASTASSGGGPQASAQPPASAPNPRANKTGSSSPPASTDAGADPSSQPLTILSGPNEHWSLSADVVLKSQNRLSTSGGSVQLAGTPNEFYIGFNFLLGDLSSTQRSWWQNIDLKGVLKAAKKPTDAYGFGVGLRGSYFKKIGLDFEIISPFVLRTHTADGWLWQYGVSVNISKALDWVK